MNQRAGRQRHIMALKSACTLVKNEACKVNQESSNPGDHHHTSSSPSTSRSASHRNGFHNVLNNQHRSIFAHPLGLPLTAMFNNRRLTLPDSSLTYPVAAPAYYNAEDSSGFAETEGNDILLASYGEYETSQTTETPWKEAQLTQDLRKQIKKDFGQHFNVVEHQAEFRCVLADINQELHENGEQGGQTTPVAVLEFGLSTADWMHKLDQGVKYLNIMLKEINQEKRFTKPLLLAIITLNKSSAGDFEFSIGVFLCSRKQKNDADADDDADYKFRLSLVWKHQDANKEDASKSFGSFLRNANRFQKWREIEVPIKKFEYLSSNCCKVGDWVSGRPILCFLVKRRAWFWFWFWFRFYLNVCLID
jgi:hypothetical protein